MNEIKTLLLGKKEGEILASNNYEQEGDWPRSADAYELKNQIGQGAYVFLCLGFI